MMDWMTEEMLSLPEKIPVELTARQLEDIIQALVLAAESKLEDAALMHEMERVDKPLVFKLTEEHDRYLQLVYWLQHVQEEGIDEIQQHRLSRRAAGTEK